MSFSLVEVLCELLRLGEKRPVHDPLDSLQRGPRVIQAARQSVLRGDAASNPDFLRR